METSWKSLTVATTATLALTLAACDPVEESGACGADGPVPGTTCLGEFETSDGDTRTYRLHFPPAYTPDTPLPLVLNLPGLAEPSQIHEWGTGMSDFADEAGFIVVYPDVKMLWLTARLGDRDVEFLSELADDLAERFAVDDRRMYVTGISSGGAMTLSLACERAEQFAAFAPVAPVLDEDARRYECDPARDQLPILLIYGGEDPTLDWPTPLSLAGEWAAHNGADTDPIVTTDPVVDEYRYVHPESAAGDVGVLVVHEMFHAWPSADSDGLDGTAEIWSFLSQHSLP